jgi:hypothetical protein
MGLLDRFRRNPTAVAETPHNTSRETVPPARPSELVERFGVERGRHETVRKAREMYGRDPRIQGMIRTLARDAAKNGFTVTVAEGPRAEEAQAAIDALVRRLHLKRKLDDYGRMAMRDGDLFLEPGVSAAREIVELTRKPTLQMVRLSDEFDRFPDPVQAFAWTDAASAAAGSVGRDAVTFPEFLMIHARWNHDSESRYGSPEFAAAVGAWKRASEGELDVAIGRKTRSGVSYVHNLVGASEADIAAYKNANQAALDKPFAARADYFINFDGGISQLQGDSNLGEIRDVEHHIQTMTAASPVPLELVAYGANLNRDVLQEKKRQYDEGIAAAQGWMADQIIEPLIERQLLLAGILPENVEYAIGWPAKRVLTPADMQALAVAVAQMRAGGWSDAAVWALVERYLPEDVTLETLFSGPPVAPPAAPDNEADEEDADDDEGDDDGVDDATTEATVPARLYAETMGAVNRLVGRLDMVMWEDDDGA